MSPLNKVLTFCFDFQSRPQVLDQETIAETRGWVEHKLET